MREKEVVLDPRWQLWRANGLPTGHPPEAPPLGASLLVCQLEAEEDAHEHDNAEVERHEQCDERGGLEHADEEESGDVRLLLG